MSIQVLVALDASEHALSAARAAIGFAVRVPDVRLTAVHVVNVTTAQGRLLGDLASLMGFEPMMVPAKVEHAFRERGQRLLDGFAARCEKAGVPCRTLLEQGSVLERLVFHGSAADLVVAGTRGETTETFEGHPGTLERVIKRLPTPVLLVPKGPLVVKRLTLAYDGSAGSQAALRVCARVAGWLEAQVTVAWVGASGADDPTDEALAGLRQDGLEATVVRGEGEPAEALPVLHARAGGDVLVVAYRGRSGLTGWLLGRVTERLLDHPELALLVTR